MTETTDAQKLLNSRLAVYGDRVENMKRTALIWSGLLGFEVRPEMVPLMMSAYKMLRAEMAPDYSDNIDDADGWNVMFREVMEDAGGIIQARTVEEYLQKKFSAEGSKTEEETPPAEMWLSNNPVEYSQLSDNGIRENIEHLRYNLLYTASLEHLKSYEREIEFLQALLRTREYSRAEGDSIVAFQSGKP